MSALILSHLLAELRERLPDVLVAVFNGDITLIEAQQLLDGTSPHPLDLLKESYAACRATMLARDATLLGGLPTTVETLEDELVRHLVSGHFFQEGRITLLQMRYATSLALDADAIEICISRSDGRRKGFFEERNMLLRRIPEASRGAFAATPTEYLRLALPAHGSATPA